jgi:hypothetical protein
MEEDVKLPSEHPRAHRVKTDPPVKVSGLPAMLVGGGGLVDIFSGKHKAGYTTMAWRWGDSSEVLEPASDKNLYCDVEGPWPADMSGDPFVKLIPLVIPGGLANNKTFWIDLNKGVRALHFPARYRCSDDFPGDAAYAKISFVENNATRNSIDASGLMFENTVEKWLADSPIDLKGITRETADMIQLNRAYHTGAYSFDSTLIVNVPQFIEASYFVAAEPKRAKPHDSLYLAKSLDIKASRVHKSDSRNKWRLPPRYYDWRTHTQKLQRTYAGQISRSDRVSLQETKTSNIGAGAELGVDILLMVASLIPYIGQLVATMGNQVLENMKVGQYRARGRSGGITSAIRSSILGEAKENS